MTDKEVTQGQQPNPEGADPKSGAQSGEKLELTDEQRALLQTLPGDALLSEYFGRELPDISEPEAEPEPEWSGHWDVPPAQPDAQAQPTQRHLYAAMDAIFVRECLSGVGLQEHREPPWFDGGFVVVASDAALVFHWGVPSGRHHGLTEARVMLRAYAQVLEHRGVSVKQTYSNQLEDLHLRCVLPRWGCRGIDPEARVVAMFDPQVATGPERDARDRRLAAEAAHLIVADLADQSDLFAFLEPSHALHISAKPAAGLRVLDARSQRLLQTLLSFHLTGQVPKDMPTHAGGPELWLGDDE